MSEQPVNTEYINRVTRLIEGLTVSSGEIVEGKHANTLFEGQDDSTQELDKALSDLVYVVDKDDCPVEKFSMKSMQCIEHDPESSFAKNNPNVKPADNWWSHLECEYNLGGKSVTSKTVSISNCYLDLYVRTGKLENSYGRDLVNVYIPSKVYQSMHNEMLRATKFDAFAQGNEIIDHSQGLTSFLCQKADRDSDLNVVTYKQVIEDDGTVVEYERSKFTLQTMYRAAQDQSHFRILGGVAFLRFGLAYQTSPGSHDPKEKLPSTVMPEVKIKVLSFHSMSGQGDKIRQVTYKRGKTKSY